MTLSKRPLTSFRSVAGLQVKLSRAFFNITPSPGNPDDHRFCSCCVCSQLIITSALISRMLTRELFRKSPAGNSDERVLGGLRIGVEIPDPPGGVTVISIGRVTATFSRTSFFFCFFGTRYPFKAFILVASFDSGLHIRNVRSCGGTKRPSNSKDEASEVFGEVD